MDANQVPPTALKPGREGSLKGRPCHICSLSLKTREAIDELMRRGDTVASIIAWSAKRFKAEGVDKFPMSAFYGHRKHHVQLVDRAASKLSDRQRLQSKSIQLARAVLNDEIDPQAYFAPAAIAQDIAKTAKRLDTAADDALIDKQHASLASLSSALIRSHELRAKLGGNIRENPEINLNVSISELHARLDTVLATPAGDRQNAARLLLGLSADPVMPQSGGAIPEPQTIDATRNPDESER